MNCSDVRPLLHPYSDGELDLVRHVQMDEHLGGCAACAEQEKHLRSLRAAISSPSLSFRAPASLRARVEQFVSPAPRRRQSPWQIAAVAASLLLLVGISAVAGIILTRARTSADDRLAERVVASHVRSMQVDHLMDVASTDQHTVKPWFRDKLDFSPQVLDLSERGYALSGGRLDYLADRPVAALLYHRRLHVINLFTWPANNEQETAVRRFARQGFHIRSWRQAGMNYWAISDLNENELDEFVRLFREQTPPAQP